MRDIPTVTNVGMYCEPRPRPKEQSSKAVEEESLAHRAWVNIQVFVLIATIVGQILIGHWYILAQTIWLVANIIAFARDYVLHRPRADKVRDGGLIILTVILIVLRLLGLY